MKKIIVSFRHSTLFPNQIQPTRKNGCNVLWPRWYGRDVTLPTCMIISATGSALVRGHGSVYIDNY